MSTRRPSIIPGLLLIIIGILFLLNKFLPFSFGWYEIYPLIFLAMGILFFVSIIGKPHKGAVFPGTILLLLGIFFILRNFDLIPYRYVREVWPIMLIIFGFAFLAIFITKPSDWGVLIPAGICLFIGGIFYANRFYHFYWDAWDLFADYWPVFLILIGAGIVLKSLRKG